MSWTSAFAIAIGAVLGAWLRWGLSVWLNPLLANLPLGTLAANLIGGLLMGIVMALSNEYAAWSPELRLFAATGFLGGLTTFSTFSGEASVLLERGDYVWSSALISAHVAGSISATLFGMWLVRLWLRA